MNISVPVCAQCILAVRGRTQISEKERRMMKKREGIILFFQTAHYLLECGYMAWSQNIMMSVNSQGTTSFC